MSGAPSIWLFNLSDTDPVFNYQPYSDGPFANGWQAGWSNLGMSPPDQDHNDGSGTSYHVTSFPNASISLTFFGTGVSLLGETNCTYDVVVDGSPVSTNVPPPLGTLYSGSNFDNTVHDVILLPHPTSSNQTLNFTGAQLVSPASSSPIPERIDNQNTSAITYSGSWTKTMAHQVPNSQNPAPYFQTKTGGSSASLNFTGRAVVVRGESNFGWWTYSANLDGELYDMNASSIFIVPDAVLFYQDGLEENATHSLTLTNTTDGMNFALNSITVYHSDKSTSVAPSSSSSSFSDEISHKISGGEIAGIAAGAIAGVVGSVLVLICLCRRRSEESSSQPIIEPFDAHIMNKNGRSSAIGSLTPTPILAGKAGAIRHITSQQHYMTANTGTRKHKPLPNLPPPVSQTHVPSSINLPSSSAIRQPETTDQASVERLADAVVERLALRFGPGDHSTDVSPPSYS